MGNKLSIICCTTFILRSFQEYSLSGRIVSHQTLINRLLPIVYSFWIILNKPKKFCLFLQTFSHIILMSAFKFSSTLFSSLKQNFYNSVKYREWLEIFLIQNKVKLFEKVQDSWFIEKRNFLTFLGYRLLMLNVKRLAFKGTFF